MSQSSLSLAPCSSPSGEDFVIVPLCVCLTCLTISMGSIAATYALESCSWMMRTHFSMGSLCWNAGSAHPLTAPRSPSCQSIAPLLSYVASGALSYSGLFGWHVVGPHSISPQLAIPPPAPALLHSGLPPKSPLLFQVIDLELHILLLHMSIGQNSLHPVTDAGMGGVAS